MYIKPVDGPLDTFKSFSRYLVMPSGQVHHPSFGSLYIYMGCTDARIFPKLWLRQNVFCEFCETFCLHTKIRFL